MGPPSKSMSTDFHLFEKVPPEQLDQEDIGFEDYTYFKNMLGRDPSISSILHIRLDQWGSYDDSRFQGHATHKRAREAIVYILNNLADTLKDEELWILDILNLEGNDADAVATLLLEERDYSPWILEHDTSTWLDRYPSQIDRNPPDFDASHHSPNCVHTPLLTEINSQNPRPLETQEKTGLRPWSEYLAASPQSQTLADDVPSVAALPTDLHLGIAGFMPWLLPFSPFGSFLNQWSTFVEHDLNNMSRISVAYSESDQPGIFGHLRLFNQSVMLRLLVAISLLQREGRCCNRLPILMQYRNNLHDVHSVGVEFSLIEELWNSLSAMDEPSQSRLWQIAAVHWIIRAIVWLVFHILVWPLFFSTTTPRRVASWVLPESLLESPGQMRLRKALDSILASLGPLGELRTLFDSNDSSYDPKLQHCTAMVVQTLCLALQSFHQGHTGTLSFTCLDTSVSEVHLKGTRLPTATVVAHLQELTCFGHLTKEPVLVFEIQEQAGSQPSRDRRSWPQNLLTTPEDVVEIWGRSGIVLEPLRIAATSEAPSHIRAILIGNGILTTHRIMDELWHWTPNTDREYARLLQQAYVPTKSSAELGTDREPPRPVVTMRTKIHIGFIHINSNCPSSTDVGQKIIRQLAQDHLHSIEAQDPYWELNTVQAGIQGGQYVVPQLMVGWQKLPGTTKKDEIVSPCNYSIVPELYRPFGLQVCLCTGVVQRVQLQTLIASCLKPYMQNRLPMPEWADLETVHKMVEAFRDSQSCTSLQDWFRNLPSNFQQPTSRLVKEILSRLRHTGVDQQAMLRIAWAQEGYPLECLKIPCTEQNLWAKILADSMDSAAFACITPCCLETSDQAHGCKKSVPQRYEQSRAFHLSTFVRPRGEDSTSKGSSNEWHLQNGKSYWIGPPESMLLATVHVIEGVTILKVKRSNVPGKLFKRMRNRATLRETLDKGAIECIIQADD